MLSRIIWLTNLLCLNLFMMSLFQKHVMRTKLDIYVFIFNTIQSWIQREQNNNSVQNVLELRFKAKRTNTTNTYPKLQGIANNFTKIVYKLKWLCNIMNFTPLYTAHSVIIVWTDFDVYCTCNILTFSMYWFLLSIFIIPYFRSLSRERSSKILLNMCVSMLLMNVAFLMMEICSHYDHTMCSIQWGKIHDIA
jgi:hypothetical protein